MMHDMTVADVDVVCAIEQVVQDYPWTRGNFIDALNQGYMCRIDQQDGAVRGYAVLRRIMDEAELLTIGVAAGQQRKGLGKAILAEMLQLAREDKMRRVFLEVRASNVAALALYRSSGFDEIGVRRGYYQKAGGCEDAITMACQLEAEKNG